MPFELTSEFLSQLAERAPKQDRLELNVLCGRLPVVKERWETAVGVVKEKFGTLKMHCALLAIAYLEPSVLLESTEPEKLEYDADALKRAFLAAEEGYVMLSGRDKESVLIATREPSFVAGVVGMPAPAGFEGYFHIDLILPGLGNVLDREPHAVGDLLSGIHFKQSSGPNLPNHVSPQVLMKRALRTDEGLPAIFLYFSKKTILAG